VNAAILVGGAGRRLGGVEKGKLVICGKTVVERILGSLEDFNTVIVCRDEEQSGKYEDWENIIVDEFRGMGPLAGIHAALKHFGDSTLIVAADMPFLRRNVALKLWKERARNKADALIPVWGCGKMEPLLAVYSATTLPEIERSLERGETKVLAPIMRLEKVIFYSIEKLRDVDEKLISFFNINTPEDLKRADELCWSTDSAGE
jgi:molybdopterin-guanine dinucleotide biosynthesis protein A